ncbi:MAG: SRPBCC family protein [Actinomycetota bacterium]
MIEPIHATVTVRRTPEDAFRVFTKEMGSWWPLQALSMAEDSEDRVKAESVVFEEREGGRVYEVMSDGTEGMWATILAWDPPRRLVLAWKPNLTDNPPTELEVTFTADGDGTRVDLEHRGWERLGAMAEEARAGYGENWNGVLALFVGAAEAR